MTPPRVIDLFTGAGGLSLGAHNAGFRTAVAIDIDEDLTSSYKANFPGTKLMHADVSKVSSSQLRELASNCGPIAGVTGGPPCQGFSEMGRRDKDDPRNALIQAFFSAVTALDPAFFLMENVPGIAKPRNASILQSALSEIPSNYTVLGPATLNAADFGAATQRKRVVVIGYDPERVRSLSLTDLEKEASAPAANVRQAIADLPEPEAPDVDQLPYSSLARTNYARRLRAAPPTGLGSADSRERVTKKVVTGVQETVHSAGVRRRFRGVGPGQRDPISRYQKLDWSKQAPVLRAGTGRDRGSYQAARPIHPTSPRVITVREAARLQGFPDWFEFAPTKWHSHRMIGNSVSPLFAEGLMRSIYTRLIDQES